MTHLISRLRPLVLLALLAVPATQSLAGESGPEGMQACDAPVVFELARPSIASFEDGGEFRDELGAWLEIRSIYDDIDDRSARQVVYTRRFDLKEAREFREALGDRSGTVQVTVEIPEPALGLFYEWHYAGGHSSAGIPFSPACTDALRAQVRESSTPNTADLRHGPVLGMGLGQVD